jgi:hypothetical protein
MKQWRKGIATWEIGSTLYISVPFTWLMEDAQKIAALHKGHVFIGGPGIMKPSECDMVEPILFHNPLATFTTRGCPNRCAFCAVPKLEGEFRELPNFRPSPVVCDNNFLAASRGHIRNVVDSLKRFKFVDFNQGLDAKRFTPDIADMLGELKVKVRFAFSAEEDGKYVKDAIDICRKRTTNDIQVYCLLNYNDTPSEAQRRLELIRSWGVLPNPMRYQPLDAREKNSYVAPGWTEYELKRMVRYYSRLNYWGNGIPYDEFHGSLKENQFCMELE